MEKFEDVDILLVEDSPADAELAMRALREGKLANHITWVTTDERTRVIPVVMVTSSAEGRDIIGSYKLGVNNYLGRPVEFEQFSETVAKAGLYWMLMNKAPSSAQVRQTAEGKVTHE